MDWSESRNHFYFQRRCQYNHQLFKGLSEGFESLLEKSFELNVYSQNRPVWPEIPHFLYLYREYRAIQSSQNILLHIIFLYLATGKSIALSACCLDWPEIHSLAILKSRKPILKLSLKLGLIHINF